MPTSPPRSTSINSVTPPRRSPGRGRVTDAFRAKAVDYVLAHRHARSLEELAAEIGVHMRTLYRWLELDSRRAPIAPVVVVDIEERQARPVVVDDTEERQARPVVVLPSGARIEGLDIAAVAELVRRLG